MSDDYSERNSSFDPGFIYLLTNRSMPGRVKVGLTSKHPALRAAELSAATAIPEPFEVAAYWDVPSCREAEAEVHRMLATEKVSAQREFFELTPEQAWERIDAVLSPSRDMEVGTSEESIPLMLQVEVRERSKSLGVLRGKIRKALFAADPPMHLKSIQMLQDPDPFDLKDADSPPKGFC